MTTQPLVVVVDDDDDIRLSLRDYLRSRGYRVEVASDGVGAIRLLIDHDVSVVVTDYRMDLLGGNYWIRFLQRFVPKMPVLVISGFLNPDFDVPYPMFLKPFDYDILEARIRTMLPEADDDR
jgi:DNA-binding response OmpR family regulator